MFYIVTYVLTTLASFGIILLLAREGFESEEITDLAGLNQRSPLYAGVMAICMFSLAGIPPLVGFYAKLAVLQALIASGQALYIGAGRLRGDDVAGRRLLLPARGQGHVLRRADHRHHRLRAGGRARRAVVNGALVLVLGILPGGLMTLCAQAIVATLGDLTRRRADVAERVGLAGAAGRLAGGQPAVPQRAAARRGAAAAQRQDRWRCGWRNWWCCTSLVGGFGLLLEQRAGQIAPQGWEFYAITGALFITLAFPGLRLALPAQTPELT